MHVVKIAHNTPVHEVSKMLREAPAGKDFKNYEHGKARATGFVSAGANFMKPEDLEAAKSHIERFTDLMHDFNKGEKSASAIIHGGTDAGLMKVVADAASGKNVPVIGISPHQATTSDFEGHGDTPMAKNTIHILTDSAETHPFVKGGKPLDVKDKYGHWGTERQVMMNVVKSSAVEGAPIFSVVGNGGGGALKEVVSLLEMSRDGKNEHHIVLLKGSGRVADALAEYYEKGASLKDIKVQVKDLAKVSKPEDAFKTLGDILKQEGVTEDDLRNHKASIHVHDIRQENAVNTFSALFHKAVRK